MRVRGSHHIYAKGHTPVRIPVHGGTPLKRGLQRHLMKLADIEETELWAPRKRLTSMAQSRSKEATKAVETLTCHDALHKNILTVEFQSMMWKNAFCGRRFKPAYFLGATAPHKSLKAEINADAWATLNSDTSRPFDKPTSGRIAVKVINHLGDEVMKVFRV